MRETAVGVIVRVMTRFSTAFPWLIASASLCSLVACVGEDVLRSSGSSVPDEPKPSMSSSSSGSNVDEGDQRDANAPADPMPSTDSGAPTVVDSGPPPATNYCSTVVAPANTDFLCIDFDGHSLDTGFTHSAFTVAGGTYARTGSVFYSSPNAIEMNTPTAVAATQSQSREVWSAVGPKTIRAIEAEFYVNPATLSGVVAPQSGTIDIAAIGIDKYTLAFNVLEASHATAGGVRSYGVCVTDTRGAAAIFCDKITMAMPVNVWTKVKLTMNAAGGSTALVRYNDLPAVTRSMSAYSSTEATVSLGGRTRGNTNPVRLRFDNLVATITRDP